MKYIIELPEEPLSILALSVVRGIPKATKAEFEPYTEPDRNAIEDEVWEFVKMLESELRVRDLRDIYSEETEIYTSYSYQEAKAGYEAWKNQKDEIRVGDEVKENSGLWGGVVVGFDEFDALVIMDSSGKSCGGYKTKFFKKTGRHFDEVEKLLEEMRSDSHEHH